ncbi:hypothetical protein E3N88_24467 [Mikania micrantha]|uniref:Uncharacterized protein n=1 Tax=Mikania micrantha TaxID=192012 RepID=A0A5N6N1X9_9ASTR|nr:hypothetical protein E3N88_24467 [Mikania micrantha]
MNSRGLNLWVKFNRDSWVKMIRGMMKLQIMKEARGVGAGGASVILVETLRKKGRTKEADCGCHHHELGFWRTKEKGLHRRSWVGKRGRRRCGGRCDGGGDPRVLRTKEKEDEGSGGGGSGRRCDSGGRRRRKTEAAAVEAAAGLGLCGLPRIMSELLKGLPYSEVELGL